MLNTVTVDLPRLPWPLLRWLVSAMQPIVVSLRDDQGQVSASVTTLDLRALEAAVKRR